MFATHTHSSKFFEQLQSFLRYWVSTTDKEMCELGNCQVPKAQKVRSIQVKLGVDPWEAWCFKGMD